MTRRAAGRWHPLACLLCVALTLLMAACSARPDDRGGTGSTLSFGECSSLVPLEGAPIPEERLQKLEFSCSQLSVPLDYANPNGDHISVPVARARLKDQKRRIGSLILNPGGPGYPGMERIPYWTAWFSDELLARFDIVTFNPRGTRAASPINCKEPEDELSKIPDLLTESGYADAVRHEKRLVEACLARLGARAPHFTTQNTARDVDLLRQALGDTKLSYVGFSYGAKLGAEYAHQFPDRVRALVLDAPPDPLAGSLAIAETQVAGFEHAFGAYADSCRTRPLCGPIGNPRQYMADLVRSADSYPIPSGQPNDDRRATGSDVLATAITLLYDDASWPVLDSALTEAKDGDSGTLFEVLDNAKGDHGAEDENDVGDTGYVINCNDSGPGPSKAEIRAAAAKLRATFPTFGAYASNWLLGCEYWRAERHTLEQPTAQTAHSILVVGTVHDPATPYSGAQSLARTLGNARLLTWEGEGHTAFGQSDCINRLVDSYLIKLALPAEGARCP